MSTGTDLDARVRRLEDESAIRRVILAYGPSADAGLASQAAALWTEDGIYDWDADGEPLEGPAAVEAMLSGDGHRGLMGQGVAHFGGPPLIDLDGDRATALSYSLVMRRSSEGRYYLWRVSAVRWDLQRRGDRWHVARRSNRLLDDTGAGVTLFREAMQDVFQEGRA